MSGSGAYRHVNRPPDNATEGAAFAGPIEQDIIIPRLLNSILGLLSTPRAACRRHCKLERLSR